jgi:hypothetical protein
VSGHADTIRRALTLVIASDRANALWDDAANALDALDALVVEEADRIAWLEGEVAGWRVKLAECEERKGE